MGDSKLRIYTPLLKLKEYSVVKKKSPKTWKTILLHYLKPVGGKFILSCDFELKTLLIKLPLFYEECFKYFAEHSASKERAYTNISKVIIWNNKAIRIGGKSVYNHSLANIGLIRIRDHNSEDNELITKHKLRELNISPLDAFKLIGVIEALPDEWRKSLSTRNFTAIERFNLQNEGSVKFKRAKRPIKQRCPEESFLRKSGVKSLLHRLLN